MDYTAAIDSSGDTGVVGGSAHSVAAGAKLMATANVRRLRTVTMCLLIFMIPPCVWCADETLGPADDECGESCKCM